MNPRPLVLAAALLFLAATAVAQTTPTFTYAKPDAVKPAAPAAVAPTPPPPVEWKAQVKGGFLMTSGNSQTTGASVTGNVSRREGNNRLTFDAGAAYGRSNVVTPVIVTDMTVTPPSNTIVGIGRTSIETNNNWSTKGRYDRFFTANNSGYVSAQAAGRSGGGQVLLRRRPDRLQPPGLQE